MGEEREGIGTDLFWGKNRKKRKIIIKHRYGPVLKNIAKGTTDPRVEFISQVQTQSLIKFYLKNLDPTSTSKSQTNISLSIKLKLQNLDPT